MENSVIKIQAHAAFIAAQGFGMKVKRIKLPVFEPNDYFFKNHQQDGEEKWETFARIIRDLMSEHSGLPKSDLTVEDKFEYKKILYP